MIGSGLPQAVNHRPEAADRHVADDRSSRRAFERSQAHNQSRQSVNMMHTSNPEYRIPKAMRMRNPRFARCS